MFDTILKTLKDDGKSGMAYAKVIALSEKAMKDDDERAAGYLILKVLAERFIEMTGRLPIKATQTEAAFTAFSADLITLRDAYQSQDSAAISKALNKTSLSCI
jgi:hypothetical protein